MLTCSIGKVTSAIVRKALSGFTFVEFNIPMDSYTDAPKFELTIDNLKQEYVTTGCEVHMQADGKAVAHIVGMLEGQSKWMDFKPLSVESADTSDLLKGMGLKDGPKVKVSFVNLMLSKGQLAIALANMSSKMAFLDFENSRVVYYTDLYKQKPLKVQGIFSRTYSRPPVAGYMGWDSNVNGKYPKDAQTILPFGNYTTVNTSVMEALATNCNEISNIFSDMQCFTATHTCDLGITVMSNLTYDKKVIVAAEEHYDMNDQVTALYYCV